MKKEQYLKIIMSLFVFFITLYLISGCVARKRPWQWVGTVAGQVTDSLGTPLAGVTISITGTDKTVKTDAKGKYEFKEVPSGEVVVIASKAGYQSVMKVITVGIEDIVLNVNFVLRVFYETKLTDESNSISN